MNKIFNFLSILSLLFLNSCKDEYSNLPDGLYAKLETSRGTIIAELNYKKAPVTVANFVTLAEGKNTFVSEEFKGKPFFNGIKFHRVIADFMIQTGDPLGNGSGDAGYSFKDEITDLKHDKAGILSMANSGPNTNSSQFFITHAATPWLDGKHTVFGQVVENGQEVVNAIQQDDYLNEVTIIRKGEGAKRFNPTKILNDYFKSDKENKAKQMEIEAENKRAYSEKYKKAIEDKIEFFNNQKSKSIKTNSGLQYSIVKDGSGVKPKNGAQVFIHYAGFLEDGTLFDSSMEAVAKNFGKYDENRALQNGYSPIPYTYGNKTSMIPGFIEGIEKMKIGDKAVLFIPSNLAYGDQGAGNVIPPKSNIIFEVELLDKM